VKTTASPDASSVYQQLNFDVAHTVCMWLFSHALRSSRHPQQQQLLTGALSAPVPAPQQLRQLTHPFSTSHMSELSTVGLPQKLQGPSSAGASPAAEHAAANTTAALKGAMAAPTHPHMASHLAPAGDWAATTDIMPATDQHHKQPLAAANAGATAPPLPLHQEGHYSHSTEDHQHHHDHHHQHQHHSGLKAKLGAAAGKVADKLGASKLHTVVDKVGTKPLAKRWVEGVGPEVLQGGVSTGRHVHPACAESQAGLGYWRRAAWLATSPVWGPAPISVTGGAPLLSGVLVDIQEAAWYRLFLLQAAWLTAEPPSTPCFVPRPPCCSMEALGPQGAVAMMDEVGPEQMADTLGGEWEEGVDGACDGTGARGVQKQHQTP
jgi:hypothetical protein